MLRIASAQINLTVGDFDGNIALARRAAGQAAQAGAAMIVFPELARNEYKRRQAPPVLRVRARAFGSGRQMPIAAHYG